jgi:hypothetical protein
VNTGEDRSESTSLIFDQADLSFDQLTLEITDFPTVEDRETDILKHRQMKESHILQGPAVSG